MKKIAVLMSNPVQYYSIQPLLEALDVVSIGYDIVIPNWDASTFQKEGWDAMEKDLESMLVKKGILFIKANETNDYSVSLTPYPEWWDVKADFKVRYRYSYVSFPAFSTAPENNMQYDVILSYGEPDAEYFSAYARTCIVTTHRPSVLTMCDKVYKIDSGVVCDIDETEVNMLIRDF